MRVEMMERAVAQGSNSDPEGKTKKMTKKAAAASMRRRGKGAARDEVKVEVRDEVRDEVKVEVRDEVKVVEGMKIQQLRAVMADEVKEVKENVTTTTRRRRRRRDAGKLHSSSGSSEQERGPAPAAATAAAPGTGDASLRWEGALPDPAAEEERMRLYRLRRRERYLMARRDLCRRLNLPPALAEPDRDSPPAPRRAPDGPYVLTADEYSGLLLLRRRSRRGEAAGAAPALWHHRQVERLAVRIAELPPVGAEVGPAAV
ncbi:protein LIAT1 [Lampetra fluviatilis]